MFTKVLKFMDPVDVHQHLWPLPLIAALRAREVPPRLEGWVLHLPGERPYPIDPAHHDPERRAALATAEGVAVVCIAPSASLGLDRVPAPEAEALAAAWLEGVLGLGAPFRAWAMPTTPAALHDALAAGAVGLEVGADRLAAPAGLSALAPLLEVLDDAGAPLLVHPGPAGPADDPARPPWWTPVVPYVAGLHAAWWAWADGGRAAFPRVPICFAALAGLGPLHGERHVARGGTPTAVDPLTYVETSSYGTRAVDAVIRVLGIDVICHGSDRPYAESTLPDLNSAAALQTIRSANPGRLLARALQEVPA